MDSPSRLRSSLFGRTVEFRLKHIEPALADRVQSFDFVKHLEVNDNRLILSLDDPETVNPVIVKALVNAGAEVQFVSEVRHSLEDVYLSLINNK